MLSSFFRVSDSSYEAELSQLTLGSERRQSEFCGPSQDICPRCMRKPEKWRRNGADHLPNQALAGGNILGLVSLDRGSAVQSTIVYDE